MSLALILRRNLGTPTVARALVLSRVAEPRATSEVQAFDYYWKYADTPDMEPQFFAKGVAGQPVSAPFDTSQDRPVIFYQIGFDSKGQPNATHPHDGEQFRYVKPTTPTLSSATFSTPNIVLAFIANGGIGTMHIMRRTGTDPFVEIATALSTDTGYTDTPPLNGTYDYQIIQDGIADASNVRSATKTGGSSGSGSPSTDLAAAWDSDHTVSITWTAFGTGGTYNIERQINGGAWVLIASGVATNSYDDTDAASSRFTRTFDYRVSKTTVTGYTNTADAEVEGSYDYTVF